jgi:hypothetical protein
MGVFHTLDKLKARRNCITLDADIFRFTLSFFVQNTTQRRPKTITTSSSPSNNNNQAANSGINAKEVVTTQFANFPAFQNINQNAGSGQNGNRNNNVSPSPPPPRQPTSNKPLTKIPVRQFVQNSNNNKVIYDIEAQFQYTLR